MPHDSREFRQRVLIRNDRSRTPSTKVLRVAQPLWYLPTKAFVEYVAALVLAVLASPVILLAALLIKLTSRGPAFYLQRRLGQYGRPYLIYKLRTMVHDCEKQSGPQWSTEKDPRVTAVGRFLRMTHVDELPQLWNVLKGDMSLIGPRPERPEFLPSLEQSIAHYRTRLLVRPGVTGLAQVLLPADADVHSVRRKLKYDLYYVENASPLLDLLILLATVCKVVGLSFSRTRQLLGLPAAPAVERAHQELVAQTTLGAYVFVAGSAQPDRVGRGNAPFVALLRFGQ